MYVLKNPYLYTSQNVNQLSKMYLETNALVSAVVQAVVSAVAMAAIAGVSGLALASVPIGLLEIGRAHV